MRLRDGQQFAGYRIVRKLGRGGMATVYLAQEESFRRGVALKVLPDDLADDGGFVARFRQEAQTVADLEHPNIVPLYRFGIEDGVPWMALRYVDGGDLAHRLARPLAIDEGLAIFRALAAALEYAHRRGVIHRDLKPQNVLLTSEGQVYLADFGVAKLLEGSASARTGTGGILGTPAYMAPEQAQGLALTPAADLYALGVMAFQWLTGALPFDADTPHAILIKQVQEPLPEAPLAKLSAPVAAVLRRALAKAPEQRHASATALVAALDQALRGTPEAARDTLAAPPPTKAAPIVVAPTPAAKTRWRRLPAIVAAALLLYVGVRTYQGYEARQAEQARLAAERAQVPGNYEGFAEEQAFSLVLDADGTGHSAWLDGSPFESTLTWKQAGLILIEAHTIGLPVPESPAEAILPDWKTLTLVPDKLASGDYLESGADDRIVRKVTASLQPWPQTGELPAGWLEHPLRIPCNPDATAAQTLSLQLAADGSARLRSGDVERKAAWAANAGPTAYVFVVGAGFVLQLGKSGDTAFASGPFLASCSLPRHELDTATN